MRVCVAILAIAFSFILPTAVRADDTYTLSVDYSGTAFTDVPGSILDVSFSEPSILTATTSGIVPLFNVSVGGALTGCVPSNAELDNPGSSSGDLFINFAAACGPGSNFDGAVAFFDTPLLAPGVYTAIGHHNMQVAGDIGTLTITAPEPTQPFCWASGLPCSLTFPGAPKTVRQSRRRIRRHWPSEVHNFPSV